MNIKMNILIFKLYSKFEFSEVYDILETWLNLST